MTLFSTAKNLETYSKHELETTISEVSEVVTDILEMVSDSRSPLDVVAEARSTLTDVYEEIQAAGTELENYQVKLEEVRDKLHYYCPDEPDHLVLNSGVDDGRYFLEAYEE